MGLFRAEKMERAGISLEVRSEGSKFQRYAGSLLGIDRLAASENASGSHDCANTEGHQQCSRTRIGYLRRANAGRSGCRHGDNRQGNEVTHILF
jgi:hypothetical protein